MKKVNYKFLVNTDMSVCRVAIFEAQSEYVTEKGVVLVLDAQGHWYIKENIDIIKE